MIRWLYRENIPAEQQHRWIQTPPFAKTKLVDYDYVRQMIKIKATEPVTTTAPISSNRKKREIIKAEMEGRGPHGDFGIQNVGLTLAEAKARGGESGRLDPNATVARSLVVILALVPVNSYQVQNTVGIAKRSLGVTSARGLLGSRP
jgi:hypothetical protein